MGQKHALPARFHWGENNTVASIVGSKQGYFGRIYLQNIGAMFQVSSKPAAFDD
ncbi:MAG: hypothetical protein V4805_09735 [Pseudomonadota bacterium]